MGSSEIVLTNTDAAYLAGFIDGDGSIRPAFIKDMRRTFLWVLRIKISITQRSADAAVLYWIKQLLKGGSIHKYANHCNQVEWTLEGTQQVAKILPQLIPYLRVKKQRAILALEILNIKDRHTNLSSFLAASRLAKQMRLANSREPQLEYIDNVVDEVKERLSVTP